MTQDDAYGSPRRTVRSLALRCAAAVFLAAIAGSAAAQLAQDIPEIEAYRLALKRLRSQTEPASLEAIFESARAVKDALLRDDGSGTVIEELSEKEFERISRILTGLIVNREEFLIVAPDAEFFLALAREHGRAADVRFFENYLATFPDGVWPSYIEQQTDVTGCTAFGSGELVARYAGWRRYRAKYRNAYARAVAEHLSSIEDEIASTCACGTKADTIRELQALADRFPGTPAGRKARARLREIENATSPMRFECLSG